MSRLFGDSNSATVQIGEVTQGIGLGQLPVVDSENGGLTVEYRIIGSFSTEADQAPTGLGLAGAITVNYGVGGPTDGGEFNITAGGLITAQANSLEDQYNFIVGLRIGRSGAAMISIPMLRLMYAVDGIVGNAIQLGGTFSVEIEDANTTWREAFDLNFSPVIGSILFIEYARDEAGADSGGLQAAQPTGTISTWNPVATSALAIFRRVVV